MAAASTRRKIYQLVGESRYQDALARVEPGTRLSIVPEPTNAHDPGAIYVADTSGAKLGYLDRETAAAMAVLLPRVGSVKLHQITGGLPDYPMRGCEISIAWDDRPELDHRRLDPEQQAFLSQRQPRGRTIERGEQGGCAGFIAGIVRAFR